MIGGIRTCLGVSDDPMFLWISSNSCPLNLLLVRSHQAEIIIVKRLIQGRNSVTRVRVEPRSFDQGRRKNDAFTYSAMYLRRSQLDVDATLVNGLRRFCNFVSIFYAPYWLQCPLASEAAVNDLEFHRAMMNYSSVDEEVAEAARHAFLRHRWYLTAELILLALCFQHL